MQNRSNSHIIYKLFSVILLTSLLLSSLGFNGVSTAKAQEEATEPPMTAATVAGNYQGAAQNNPSSVITPELAITSISFLPASPFTNDDVNFLVDISNTSSIDASGFFTDFYVDHVPTGCQDWGSYYDWSGGLAANSTITWSVRIPASILTPSTHQFYVYADSGCNVTESDKSNNVSAATTFTLTIPSTAPPAHDDFDSARLIPAVPYNDNSVDVSGATKASDDPIVPACGGYGLTPGMASVWYKYTPPDDATANLDTLGSNYDTYLAVWTGARGSLTLVTCNDDYNFDGGIYQSSLQVNLTAGTTYYFEVAEYSDSLSANSLSTMDTGKSSRTMGTPAINSTTLQKPASDIGEQAGGMLNFHLSSTTSTAILSAPSGNIGANYNPTYTWSDVPGSTWYWLSVDGSSGNVILQWYTSAQANCNGTTCSVTPATTLAIGNYTWKVMTYNVAGNGSWSSAMSFSTTLAGLPGAATLSSPTGNIGTNYNPIYTWNQVADSTWYYLWVDGPNGNMIKQWYTTAQANCNGTTCSVTPATTLAGGAHTWKVQTWNDVGYGPWSSTMSFSTTASGLPGTATLVTPTGSVGTNYNPTYTWNQVTGSTWYLFSVDGPSGNVILQWYTTAQAACNGTTCSVTPATALAGGTAYTWKVMTYNSSGNGPWSSTLSFSTSASGLPGAATLVTPMGTIGTNYHPTYTWNQVTGSTWYYLWVDGPSGNVIQQWYTSAQAACNGTTCSVTPTMALAIGTYTWKVQTWNPIGSGPWSSNLAFSLTLPPAPGATTPYTPSGNILTNYNPTYTWNQVTGTTWYYLSVDGPSGNVILQWYSTAQAACNGRTCSVTPATSLAGGAYTWKVQTYNASGNGPWSTSMSISTSVPVPPGATTLVTPTGSIGANHNPTYSWNQVTGSTWYYLWVNGPSGALIQKWYSSAQANCNGVTCSVTPTTSLAGGAYTWWVETYNSSGNGPWSSGMNFTVSP